MSTLLQAITNEQTVTTTENGAVTYSSSLSHLVDLFALGGALRNRADNEVIALFSKAFVTDQLLALKMLFYFRNIRGGQGERKVFRTCLKWLANVNPRSVELNIHNVVHYGRWDDLFILKDTPVWKNAILPLIRNKFLLQEKPDLFWKWIPSNNCSSKESKKLANEISKYLGITPRQYRKTLSQKRAELKLVENDMCKKNWSGIQYSQVPSRASLLYSKAFARNDSERYGKYIEDVKNGNVKINAATLYPYDIVGKCLGYESAENATYDQLWKALPNYLGEDHSNSIVVADVSGSMSGRPMEVSISLAIYIAERNKGLFKDHFITFSEKPTLQKVIGDTIFTKCQNLQYADWGMNTNLEATFNLILDTAKKNNLSSEELPSTIYIISDMEFDVAVRNPSATLLENTKYAYENAGYKMPTIVFWNVNSRNNNIPVRYDEGGACLVSGCSPSILKSVLSGEVSTPEKLMLDTLNDPAYDRVVG